MLRVRPQAIIMKRFLLFVAMASPFTESIQGTGYPLKVCLSDLYSAVPKCLQHPLAIAAWGFVIVSSSLSLISKSLINQSWSCFNSCLEEID
jgi:hypothetical protein